MTKTTWFTNDERVTTDSILVAPRVRRIKSQDLFAQIREIEIEHDGRIYRLQLTRLNRLILTA